MPPIRSFNRLQGRLAKPIAAAALGLACVAGSASAQAGAAIVARATVVNVEPALGVLAGVRGLLRSWDPGRDAGRRFDYGLATISVQRGLPAPVKPVPNPEPPRSSRPGTTVIAIQFLRN